MPRGFKTRGKAQPVDEWAPSTEPVEEGHPIGEQDRPERDEERIFTNEGERREPLMDEPDPEIGEDRDLDGPAHVREEEMPGMWERADVEGGRDEAEAEAAGREELIEAVTTNRLTQLEQDTVEAVTPGAERKLQSVPAPQVADVAPYGNQYDWNTATWTAPRGSATKPCGCNKLVGHQCELTTKSRFATGHDARFKGILQKAFRAGRKLEVDFEESDQAFVEGPDGTRLQLVGRYEMEADQIARLLAPKLLPHVVHDTRAAKLQKADAEAGTTVPQTAVDAPPKADEDLTDADLAEVQDDASPDEFVEA